jgi:hypothetical protein
MSVGFRLMGITTGVRSTITSVCRRLLTDESQSAASRKRLAKPVRLCSTGRASASAGRGGAPESMSLLRGEILLITKKNRWKVHLTFRRHGWMSMHERGTT